jgi:hypothetical protein
MFQAGAGRCIDTDCRNRAWVTLSATSSEAGVYRMGDCGSSRTFFTPGMLWLTAICTYRYTGEKLSMRCASGEHLVTPVDSSTSPFRH